MNDALWSASWILLMAGLYIVALVIRQALFRFSALVFDNNKSGIFIYSVLFLPGVLVHEMAHFVMAVVLRVPTGKIEIFPSEMSEGRVKMGSVQVAKSDFVRSSLIGAAPLIVGMAMLIFLAQSLELSSGMEHNWLNWGMIYLLVVVSNSMFTSREDRRGWFGLGLLIIIGLIVTGYIVGFDRLWSELITSNVFWNNNLSPGLWLVLKINMVIAGGLWISNKVLMLVRKKI